MLITLTGPSGVGKGYVKQKLLARFPHIRELVWLTTRPLRTDELSQLQQNRIHTTQEHLAKLRASGGIFFEQTLFGQTYALPTTEIERAVSENCITEARLDTLSRLSSSARSVFSFGLVTRDIELLRERMCLRDAHVVNDIAARATSALIECEEMLRQQHVFTQIIEVTRENEHLVADIVIGLISQHLNQGD